jgi:hypothetical protein
LDFETAYYKGKILNDRSDREMNHDLDRYRKYWDLIRNNQGTQLSSEDEKTLDESYISVNNILI